MKPAESCAPNGDETWHIFKEAVTRGKARKKNQAMSRIGIDKKAFRKEQKCVSMIYDLHNSTVEAISDSNNNERTKDCFLQLSEEQIAGMEAIAMDMSAASVKSTRSHIPLAE